AVAHAGGLHLHARLAGLRALLLDVDHLEPHVRLVEHRGFHRWPPWCPHCPTTRLAPAGAVNAVASWPAPYRARRHPGRAPTPPRSPAADRSASDARPP